MSEKIKNYSVIFAVLAVSITYIATTINTAIYHKRLDSAHRDCFNQNKFIGQPGQGYAGGRDYDDKSYKYCMLDKGFNP